MSRPRIRRTVVTAAVALLALAACTPGSGGGDSPDEPATTGGETAEEVSTDISELGDVTLVVWDQEVRGGQNEQMEQLNAAFMERYPNVTIERNTMSNDDLTTTLRLALTGDDAPDVTQVNNSRSQMGQYVAAGQLRNLDDYAEAYGWTDRFSDSVLQNTRYSADGVTFGEGSIWGLPQVGEVVGVYYSKSRLEELGLEVPQTWAEFGEQLATIREAGQTPLLLGNLDQWPAAHVFGPVQGAHVDPDEIRALGFGNAGASWETDENRAAAEELAAWVEAGYFNDGFNGADYDAVWQSFTEGEGVYLMAGSWLGPDIEAAMGEDAGFFAPPPVEAGGPRVTTGGTGIPFAVTASSDVPDVGAAYIDFITSEEAMAVLAETGNMPVVETSEHMPDGGLQADIYAAYSEVTEEGALVPYLDWATPTMSDTLGQSLQSFLGGQLDVDGLLAALEADYSEFVASTQ
ncbi:extracellular solute-binding protein [uncultured Georgenia sp.]|uniref:ABC transporter substrate-binding protein n=1 Tax=uncultured Georgenia sp. TaxID=378209 RepID=UPI002628C895|nr:extracellular solute-binding protein [uncultured Georgenia sp.]HLV03876.1 extracellular solute-binding protein [Actinomycetaceae bacterium]